MGLPPTRDSDTATEPLAWEPHQLDGGKQDLSVSISAEAMLGVAKPVMLPMLLASHVQGVANPLASLTVDLLRWALRLSRSVQPAAADPAMVTLTHLRDMQTRLRAPKKPQKTSLSRWGAKPLDYAVVRKFLCNRVRFKLVTVRSLLAEQLLLCQAAKLNAPDRPSGIQLPWFGEIDIYARTKVGAETLLRELYGAQRQDIDPDWEAELYERLCRTRPDYKPEASALLKSSYLRAGLYEIDISSKPAVDAIVEDWAAALVLGITQRAIELFNSKVQPTETNLDPELDFRTLCSELLACDNGQDSIALQVAQQASAFLHHGARVPTPPGSAKGDLALAELLKLEVGFDELLSGPDVYLHFRAASADLFNGTADLDPFEGNAATAALTAAGAALKAKPIAISVEVEAPEYLPRRIACDKEVPLAPATKGGQAISFLPFPSWISMKLAADTQGIQPLALSLQIEQEGGQSNPCRRRAGPARSICACANSPAPNRPRWRTSKRCTRLPGSMSGCAQC